MHIQPTTHSTLTLPLLLLALLLLTRLTTAKLLSSTSFGIDPLTISTFSGFGPSTPPNLTSILYDPSHAHSGPGYLAVTFPDPSALPPLPPNTPRAQYVTFVEALQLKPNRTYVASVWAKSPYPDGKCYVAVGFHGNVGGLLNVTTEVVSGTWERVRQVVDSGEQSGSGGASYFYVSCTGGVGETVWLDDYEVVLR